MTTWCHWYRPVQLSPDVVQFARDHLLDRSISLIDRSTARWPLSTGSPIDGPSNSNLKSPPPAPLAVITTALRRKGKKLMSINSDTAQVLFAAPGEAKITSGPLPGSQKTYTKGTVFPEIRVPARQVSLS